MIIPKTEADLEKWISKFKEDLGYIGEAIMYEDCSPDALDGPCAEAVEIICALARGGLGASHDDG